MSHDLDPKQVQIAHVDRDPANSSEGNLVPLCLNHHDLYDSRSRQTKSLTPQELKLYSRELLDILEEKSRTVITRFVGADGTGPTGMTDASRLGAIARRFDEECRREQRTGLALLHLVQRNLTEDGDLAAARESVRALMRLTEQEPRSRLDESASFLLRRNVVPVASPLVALARALATAADTDFGYFLGLARMSEDWAFTGLGRTFKDTTIADVPQPHAEAHLVIMAALAVGDPVACADWARDMALTGLADFTSRITIAYALQGRRIPDAIEVRCLNGQGYRTAPPVHGQHGEEVLPDVWYRALEMIGRLPSEPFDRALSHLPASLADWEPLFDVSPDAAELRLDQAKNLADLWTTRWSGVSVGGRVYLRTHEELVAVREHARESRAKAEAAIARLERCLRDERALIWGPASRRC